MNEEEKLDAFADAVKDVAKSYGLDYVMGVGKNGSDSYHVVISTTISDNPFSREILVMSINSNYYEKIGPKHNE